MLLKCSKMLLKKKRRNENQKDKRVTDINRNVEEICTSFFFFGLLPPSSSSSELLFFDELESLERPNEPVLDLLPPLPGVGVPLLLLLLLLFLYVFMNSAMSSGQSRFFSGSHVLCLLWKFTVQHVTAQLFITSYKETVTRNVLTQKTSHYIWLFWQSSTIVFFLLQVNCRN